MKRRQFIAGATIVLPTAARTLSARAQGQPPLVGVIRVNAPSAETFIGGFRRDMMRLGFEEVKTYRTRLLFAAGDSARLPALAVEQVNAGAQLLVVFGNPGVAAAQKATREIPIVAMADDLVGAGLVASMARPGGNTTGVSIMGFELDAKRLEVLHELVPQARRIAVFVDPTLRGDGGSVNLDEPARKLGLQTVVLRAQGAPDLQPALTALRSANVEAVQFLASPFLNAQRAWFVQRLRELKIPAMYEWPETVEEGGLISYAPRLSLCYRYLAVQVGKILKGARPADLPIEQPQSFVLAVNTGAARAIGLQIPAALLLRADIIVD